jgi:hypothetical protein
MLARQQHNNSIGAGNVYDCNIDFVKPKRTALLNFAILKGREESPRKQAEK